MNHLLVGVTEQNALKSLLHQNLCKFHVAVQNGSSFRTIGCMHNGFEAAGPIPDMMNRCQSPGSLSQCGSPDVLQRFLVLLFQISAGSELQIHPFVQVLLVK